MWPAGIIKMTTSLLKCLKKQQQYIYIKSNSTAVALQSIKNYVLEVKVLAVEETVAVIPVVLWNL